MRKIYKKLLVVLPALFLALVLSAPLPSSAASQPAKITSCKLVSSNKVRVTVSIPNTGKIRGKKCHLFALSISNSKLTRSMKPVQSKKKAKHMTFNVPLKASKSKSRLYTRFVLAQKNSNGTYSVISNEKYVSNPKKIAENRYAFPTAASKKGLQVNADMLEDAAELNVNHSLINIVFTDLIASSSEQNESSSIPYSYHGKTYWFRRGTVSNYDRQLTSFYDNDTVVSAVLLLGWRDDLTHLIYPDGRERGHSFYAWNTSNKAAREQLQATISFLAERYASSSAAYGRIANWIVGNEVNNYKVYNYAGQKTLSQYAKIYANAFRMTYNTVASIYSKARVYISLDHLWNTNTVNGTFAARKMLDAFASALKSQGNIPWNLAYHPYSSPLTEPRFWANTNGQITSSLKSPVINMGNINILTKYIRKNYGSDTRIILSEQGYTSVQGGRNVEKEQSAAIAYSYYLTESDSMIDSFIMNRHVDHNVEVAQGLNLGLWTTDTSSGSPEWANEKKDSWNVFKYMDTNLSEQVTTPLLSVIGIGSWSDVIPGFSQNLYSKTDVASAALLQVGAYQGTASIDSGWKPYGAASGMTTPEAGTVRTVRDSSRNRSSLWGFSQKFGSAVNFKKHPVFYTTLRVNGAQASQVLVKLRFYSGKNILECSRTIPTGASVNLGVSLANWKYRKSVSKIQVLVEPVSGGWNSGASMTMTLPVRGQ